MTSLQTQLQSAFSDLLFESEVSLAPFTTVKIGGPAEILVSISTTASLVAVLKFCRSHQIETTILGWGANTLIADRGIRGVVIRNQTKELTIEAAKDVVQERKLPIAARHQSSLPEQAFSPLDYHESKATPRVFVTVASGWPLASLISTLLSKNITGLQWYSRIPATVGGAITNNIHGGTHFISEVIDSVRVLMPANQEQRLTAQDCEFGYDHSRFHGSGEVILDARLLLWQGDVERARATVAEWAKRKQRQPQRSLGCTFQNVSSEDQQKLKLPTPSIGYIIEHILGLKGERIGGAQISLQHAAFIENVDQATAQDYLALALKIQQAAKLKLGLSLKPEIFFRGFAASELAVLSESVSP